MIYFDSVSDRYKQGSTGNGWMVFQNEFYIRGSNGNELATCKDTTLVEWYVYGNDLVGKIKRTTGYYYYKDHLGSVRAIVNDNGELVSAQDYDGWGYLLQNRIFDSDSTKFKFTGKERDKESEYDYFGARYYDSRIGRWGSVDPLLEKNSDFTPYNYVLNNPLFNRCWCYKSLHYVPSINLFLLLQTFDHPACVGQAKTKLECNFFFLSLRCIMLHH